MTKSEILHEILWRQACLRVSPVEMSLAALRAHDFSELAADLGDKAAEAALAGNPKRAHYYENWAKRWLPEAKNERS